LVGAIIGVGGSIIKQLKESTGTNITVARAEHGNKSRAVVIEGEEQAISKVIQLLQEKLNAERERLKNNAS